MEIRYRWLPNMITSLRFAVSIPLVIVLWREDYAWALIIFMFASFSDMLDGFLARRFGWISHWGSLADPLADKLLLLSVYVLFTIKGLTPVWFLAVVLLRDLVIVTGAVIYYFKVNRFTGSPTLISKACTFMLMLYGLALAFDAGVLQLMPQALWVMQTSVVVLCVVSGVQYVILWSRRWIKIKSMDS